MVNRPKPAAGPEFQDEPAPHPTECKLAGILHLCSIPWPLVAPAVGWLLHRRSSRFVTAHALQALFETIVLNVLLFVATVAALTYSIVTLWGHYQAGWENFSVWPFLIRFAAGFLFLGVLWLFNTLVSIRQAVRAFQGHWPRQRRFLRRMSRGASRAR